MSSADIDTLVLGIGNILWADEGFGVRCVEELNANWEFPRHVRLMDGGTQGMFLLPWISNVSSPSAVSRSSSGITVAVMRRPPPPLRPAGEAPEYGRWRMSGPPG